ncbi:hypothetical protein RHMOL_Rhmol01G0328500 [Rhododendron molle]|uniref:Uncharacterized protein n=1 Tax=Rhododendron molle TaxID=49168 RepID=A0ACC0Q7Q9_RHOML|nr:hypothetical protein RHMOL_Rhmol01G0328500 [Rhododendron molle]
MIFLDCAEMEKISVKKVDTEELMVCMMLAEAGNPPVSQVETVYPKKFHRVLSSAPATENRHLNGHGDRTDQLKMTSDRQLSVFDLLGDDGPNESLQENPKHEAHVAFAIEGLGKVETETPVHSPQQPGRMFSYGSSSPLEVARQRQSSKNFDDLLYDLELDVGAMSQDMHSGSYLDDPFCSRGTVNLHSEQGQKVSTGKAYSRFNINASSLKNFADDKMSYNIADEDNDIWKDGNFLDEDCDITWNGSPLEINGSSSEFWNLGSHEMSDFALEDLHFEKMVTEKARGRFNISVRNNANKRSPSNSVARQNIRRHGNDTCSPANKCSSEKYAKVRPYEKSDDLFEGKKINGAQKFAKICNLLNPNQAHFSNALFHKKLGPEDSFSCEEGYISAKMDSGFSSFRQTSGSEKCASAHPKIWTKDPFGAYPLPGAHVNVKSSFERSKHDVLHELSPAGKFSSEKLAICEPYDHDNSYDTPIFSSIGSRRCKRSIFTDSKVEGRPQDLFPVEGSQKDAEFLHVPVEVSVAKDGENRSEKQQSGCAKVELQNDICMGSNDLSSENGQSLEASESKDNCSDCKEAWDLIPEMENQKADGSPQHAEEISSFVKIGHKFDDIIDEKAYHNDVQTSLLQQNESTAVTHLGVRVDDSGAKEMRLESKGRNIDPSCQVMMLESYVLQLLCVQKVLKEASVHDTMKKEEPAIKYHTIA